MKKLFILLSLCLALIISDSITSTSPQSIGGGMIGGSSFSGGSVANPILLPEGILGYPSLEFAVSSDVVGGVKCGITTGYAIFNGTKDPVMSWGYNVGILGTRLNLTEPNLYWQIEGDWNVDGTQHVMECHLNYTNATGVSGATRPFYFIVDRTTDYMNLSLSADLITLQGLTRMSSEVGFGMTPVLAKGSIQALGSVNLYPIAGVWEGFSFVNADTTPTEGYLGIYNDGTNKWTWLSGVKTGSTNRTGFPGHIAWIQSGLNIGKPIANLNTYTLPSGVVLDVYGGINIVGADMNFPVGYGPKWATNPNVGIQIDTNPAWMGNYYYPTTFLSTSAAGAGTGWVFRDTATPANVVTILRTVGGVSSMGIGMTPNSRLAVSGLPIYANNAAAIAGGLAAGDFYRTGADPDPVCVVH